MEDLSFLSAVSEQTKQKKKKTIKLFTRQSKQSFFLVLFKVEVAKRCFFLEFGGSLFDAETYSYYFKVSEKSKKVEAGVMKCFLMDILNFFVQRLRVFVPYEPLCI